MKIRKASIELYIPQRAPFIMVDNLIDATSEKFETDFRIESSNIFIEEDVLREFALIENIAQSSAAGLGYLNSSSQSVALDGFIAGISKLIVYDLPRVNETVHTIIHTVLHLKHMYLLRGECFVNGKKLIECDLKLVGITAQPKDLLS